MSEVEAKRQTDVHTLVCVVDEFVSDNKHARVVNRRWFAKFMEDVSRIAKQVNSDSLDPLYVQQVREFRLAEIEAEQARLQKEMEVFEREAVAIRGIK